MLDEIQKKRDVCIVSHFPLNNSVEEELQNEDSISRVLTSSIQNTIDLPPEEVHGLKSIEPIMRPMVISNIGIKNDYHRFN